MKMMFKFVVLAAAVGVLPGCLLTKLVSVPMRVGGAVVSVVPAVGNSAHDAIDEAAETVDALPI